MKTTLAMLAVLSAVALSTSAYAQPAARAKPAPKTMQKPASNTKAAVRDFSFVTTESDNRYAMVAFTALMKVEFPQAVESINSTFNEINIFDLMSGAVRARDLNPNSLKDIATMYLTISWMTYNEKEASDSEPNRTQLVGSMPLIDQLVRNNHRAFTGDATARRRMAQKMIGYMATTEWRLGNVSSKIGRIGIGADKRQEVRELLGIDLYDYDLKPTGLVKRAM